MNILITGGAGFIGSNLANKLIELGNKVYVTGKFNIPSDHPNKIQINYGINGIDYRRLPTKLDILFHMAAFNDTLSTDEDEMEYINVLASLELFKKVTQLGCKKIIYASSTAVYGNLINIEAGNTRPLNAYARSKELLENAASHFSEDTDIVTIGLRYCNVYGPNESHKGKRASLIYQMAQQIRKRPPTLFKFGEQRRDYIFIDDVVEATIIASQLDSTNVINCGTGQNWSFNEIFEELKMIYRANWTGPKYIDNPCPELYQNETKCDITRMKALLSFTPRYDLKSGIREYVKRGL